MQFHRGARQRHVEKPRRSLLDDDRLPQRLAIDENARPMFDLIGRFPGHRTPSRFEKVATTRTRAHDNARSATEAPRLSLRSSWRCLMRPFLSSVLLLVLAAFACAEETRDDRIAKFLGRCDDERKKELAAMPARIKAETLLLGRIRAGRITPGIGQATPEFQPSNGPVNFVSKEAKQEHIDASQKRLASHKVRQTQLTANDPPFVAVLAAHQMRVGDLGRRLAFFKVISIVDGDEMIVHGGGPRSVDPGPFWLRGFRTEGKADGTEFTIGGCIEVTGTKAYTNALGAKATVFVIEPFDMQAAIEAAAQK
jgi:hypothetical protein